MAKKDVNKARDYLKSVIYLVGKFQDKDSFELYYKRMLDRRLLEPISNNLHLEKFFLERLTVFIPCELMGRKNLDLYTLNVCTK